MTASEKVAYLKGLAEGLGIDGDTAESKLMLAMLDVLDSLAIDIEDLEANTADMAETLDELSEDIAYVEDLAMGDMDDEDEDFDDEGDFGCSGDCAGCSGCGDEQEYEVTCPKCGEVITAYESDLEFGSIFCPSCNSELEFDIDEEEEDGE